MSLSAAEWYRLASIAEERSGAPAGFMPTATQRLLDEGLIQITGRIEVEQRVKFAGTARVTDQGKARLLERP